ncbi:MAG: 16S rRNA (guanine(527)-N(7))-methyltransferase RsmG [Candidatus Gastranaerophilaceae bacterium]
MKTEQFIKLFEEYNAHTNLMSKNDVQKLKEKHIPDSLAIKNFFDKYGLPEKLADIGTGGGFPSIPIALNFPQIEVWAIDSIAKKIKFIELLKNELSLKNLFPICTRIEDFEKKEFFDVVTSRALADLRIIAEYSAPFVKKNGYFVAYKSKGANDELLQAEKALKILGLHFVEKIDYNLAEDTERCLLVFKKIKNTPKIYPRKNNLARKNPL